VPGPGGKTATEWPVATRRRTTFKPMKPEPPMTRSCILLPLVKLALAVPRTQPHGFDPLSADSFRIRVSGGFAGR